MRSRGLPALRKIPEAFIDGQIGPQMSPSVQVSSLLSPVIEFWRDRRFRGVIRTIALTGCQ